MVRVIARSPENVGMAETHSVKSNGSHFLPRGIEPDGRTLGLRDLESDGTHSLPSAFSV